MYGGLVLFESEFVHVVAISFTALVLTELLMVALTVRTWHWLMVLAEFFSLGCYLASLAFLNEYFGGCPVLLQPMKGSDPCRTGLGSCSVWFCSLLLLLWFCF